jgi:hypothetical protein
MLSSDYRQQTRNTIYFEIFKFFGTAHFFSLLYITVPDFGKFVGAALP